MRTPTTSITRQEDGAFGAAHGGGAPEAAADELEKLRGGGGGVGGGGRRSIWGAVEGRQGAAAWRPRA